MADLASLPDSHIRRRTAALILLFSAYCAETFLFGTRSDWRWAAAMLPTALLFWSVMAPPVFASTGRRRRYQRAQRRAAIAVAFYAVAAAAGYAVARFSPSVAGLWNKIAGG